MNPKQFFFWCFILLLFSCQKEGLPDIVHELEFHCPEEKTESFFEGFIGDKQFCYYDNVENYEIDISKTTGFRTGGATTSIPVDTSAVSNFRVWGELGFKPKTIRDGELFPQAYAHLQHYIHILTPANKSDLPLSDIIKNHIVETGSLPIQDDQFDEFEGFNILFQFNDLDEGVTVFLDSASGNQDDSYLQISALDITQLPDGKRHYDVTFEFACNLLLLQGGKKFL